jgi:tetratricopeptide (TPR) repeat protein
MRLPSTLAFAFAIATLAARVVADEPSELAKGRYAYSAHSYEDADAAFRVMLDPKAGTLHDAVLVNEARMYWGATLIALGRSEDAIQQFEAILAVDSKYEPDPAVFPVQVGYVFIDTRARFQEKARQLFEQQAQRDKQRKEWEEASKKAMVERLRQLEKLASEDVVMEPHSRWIALIPFGAGQFQNGQTGFGWFLLSTEALLLAGALTTIPIYLTQLHDSSAAYQQGLQNVPIAQQYLDRANQARIANLVFNGALDFTMIAGVVQAQIVFNPEVRRVRIRTHAPPSPGAPDRSPTSPGTAFPALTFGAVPVFGGEANRVSGAVLGVSGRF